MQRGLAMLFLACAVAAHLLMQHNTPHVVGVEEIAGHQVEVPHPLEGPAAHGDASDVALICAVMLAAAVGIARLARFPATRLRPQFTRGGIPCPGIAWRVRAGPSPVAAGVLLRI